MKTGDPKQVAILAVVALGAIGFVGSSAIKTVKQNSFSGPVVVEELRPDGTTATRTEPVAPNSADSAVSDVFADSFTQPPAPDEQTSQVKFGNTNTEPPVAQPHTESNAPEPLSGLPKADEPEEEPLEPEVVKVPPKTKSVQYLGFVESASASAILIVDGTNQTVTVGESLGDGFVIVAISSETLTVKSKTGSHKISIGKERQIL